MTRNTKATASARKDVEHPQSNIPEPPDVPVGGIPDLADDPDQVIPNPSSSEAAEREQERQQKSGEENPA
jgi:hypothetical protein